MTSKYDMMKVNLISLFIIGQIIYIYQNDKQPVINSILEGKIQ